MLHVIMIMGKDWASGVREVGRLLARSQKLNLGSRVLDVILQVIRGRVPVHLFWTLFAQFDPSKPRKRL